jgi:hypothetical protein
LPLSADCERAARRISRFDGNYSGMFRPRSPSVHKIKGFIRYLPLNYRGRPNRELFRLNRELFSPNREFTGNAITRRLIRTACPSQRLMQCDCGNFTVAFRGIRDTSHAGVMVRAVRPLRHKGIFGSRRRRSGSPRLHPRRLYQHCSEKHLHRYLSEFDLRYSNRVRLGVDDAERAQRAIKGADGRRLYYRPPRIRAA